MLALLLARQGISVVLLEAHVDFEREFRGDTVHPTTLEVLDQLGLAERFLELPHRKIRQGGVPTTPPLTIDFGSLPSRFPYITMMPQSHFLEFITREAASYPSFTLLMGATVRELIRDDQQIVRGVRFQTRDGRGEVRALLTVGADGRFSRLRHLADLRAIKSSPPIDVLWFRLPRLSTDRRARWRSSKLATAWSCSTVATCGRSRICCPRVATSTSTPPACGLWAAPWST